MRKNILLFFAGLLAIFSMHAQTVLADDEYNTPPPKVAIVDLLQKLQSGGYYWVNKVKYEHGAYELKGLNDKGSKVTASLNSDVAMLPANLPFSKIQPKSPVAVTMLQAVQKVIATGYNDIRKVELEDNSAYEVVAVDGNGKKYDFKVDKATGKVSKEKWFE